jgi:hypothetical protein
MFQDTEHHNQFKAIAVHGAVWDYTFRGAQTNAVCYVSCQTYVFFV